MSEINFQTQKVKMSDFHFIYEKSYDCEINISSIQAKY